MTTDEEISSSHNDIIDVGKECSRLESSGNNREPLLMRGNSNSGIGMGESSTSSLLSPLNPVLNYHRGGSTSLHRLNSSNKKLPVGSQRCDDEIYGFTPLNNNNMPTELSTFQGGGSNKHNSSSHHGNQNQSHHNIFGSLPPPPPPPPASVLTPSLTTTSTLTANNNNKFSNPIYSFYPEPSPAEVANQSGANMDPNTVGTSLGAANSRNFFNAMVEHPVCSSLKLISKKHSSPIADVRIYYLYSFLSYKN